MFLFGFRSVQPSGWIGIFSVFIFFLHITFNASDEGVLLMFSFAWVQFNRSIGLFIYLFIFNFNFAESSAIYILTFCAHATGEVKGQKNNNIKKGKK